MKYESFFTDDTTIRNVLIGALSGVLLYAVFFFGKLMLLFLHSPLVQEISALYSIVGPSTWWHYIVLFFIIVPGEELFWRGFIQKRLVLYFHSSRKGIFLASILYASAHFYSNSTLLIVAAFVAGIFWGILYQWKKNIWLNIVSHLVFDLLLLIVLPL
ncbi:CPBP family intramembrane metalloprotease [Bacillus timonensis]|nr:CPBP family intramembrane metalloprotease [Bacillus timonensis]